MPIPNLKSDIDLELQINPLNWDHPLNVVDPLKFLKFLISDYRFSRSVVPNLTSNLNCVLQINAHYSHHHLNVLDPYRFHVISSMLIANLKSNIDLHLQINAHYSAHLFKVLDPNRFLRLSISNYRFSMTNIYNTSSQSCQ